MPVSFLDLLTGFEFANSDGGSGGHQVLVCKRTGKIYWRSEFSDLDDDLNDEELPDDIEDEDKYLVLPDRYALDLGKPLVLDFARTHLPDHFDEVRNIFSRKGAYKRFRALLIRTKALDRWYDFEAEAKERALREWCRDNSIDVVD
jgi:hypothetical protein